MKIFELICYDLFDRDQLNVNYYALNINLIRIKYKLNFIKWYQIKLRIKERNVFDILHPYI